MKNIFTKSLTRLGFLLLSILLVSFLVSSLPPRVESQIIIEQEDAATAIATVCSSLIEGCARNPSLCFGDPGTMVLVDKYNDAVDDILLLELESNPTDIALAIGIVRSALITAIARNPSISEDLTDLESICLEDIESL